MNLLQSKGGILKRLPASVGYDLDNVDVYIIGSGRPSKANFFNERLSDIDLLFVCGVQSLEDYVRHFEQIGSAIVKLESFNNQLIEAFFASREYVRYYTECLATIGGFRELASEDLLSGRGEFIISDNIVIPSPLTKSRLYKVRARNFCIEYGRLLPIADSSKARKISKVLLRGFKLLIVSSTPIDELARTEEALFSMASFEEVENLLRRFTGRDIIVDQVIKDTLAGKDIEDWSAWVQAQDKIARDLLYFEMQENVDITLFRLHETIGAIVQDMLIVGLKNILTEPNAAIKSELIETYVCKSSSLIARLALSGVESVYNLEEQGTPDLVQQSYRIIEGYLRGKDATLHTLAAAVVLLEYSLAQSIAFANDIGEH